MRDRFLAIGEAMVEMAPDGDGRYAMGFAGDAFNTAWYARRALPADWRVGFLSAVGTDALSDRMLAFMEAGGVETRWVRRVPDRTVGLYLIELDAGERRFAYWRSASAARTLAADPAWLDAALATARIAYLSGITLAILPEADRARLLSALAAARAAGCVVAFDPNIRPALWADPAETRAALAAAARVADVALPGFEEEAGLCGDADPAATAARWRAAGAGLVVVKNGAGPVVAADAGAVIRRAVAPAATVVDTTAAGDSFNAAFLAAWAAGRPVAEAIDAGAALAAQVVGRRGALVERGAPPGAGSPGD
jgi:2-dehydro-3-deoxygluconokinase